MNLSRNPHTRHTAGVDADAFADYSVGQRVMTPEGIPGVVTAVQDGPFPGTEAYEVTLDDDLGGGTYGTSELLAIEGHEAALVEGNVIGEYTVPAPVDDPSLHLASEDYPELAEILVERPPLAHSEPLTMTGSKTATTQMTCPDCGATFYGDGVGASHGCQGRVDTQAALDFALFEGDETDYNPAQGGDPGVFSGEDEPEFLATEAGLWDHVLAPVVDRMTRHIDKGYPGIQQGTAPSFDWCRFRRDRHCFFPREMDLPATQQAGYVVWKPLDRGICGRDAWDKQKMCPVSEPGPNSGVPLAKVDATVPWSEGGQRGVLLGSLAHGDGDHVFEFTAAWADVRRKASEIRRSGGVRVLSITGDRSSGRVVTGEVRGDTNVYETSIQSEPGRSNVALWTCGCPWAAYSWGRSGRWKKYEGRMCSHALALTYESQTKNLMEQPDAPWDSDQVKRPGDYDPDAQRYWASKTVKQWHPVHTDGHLSLAPAVWIAHAMLTEGSRDQEVVAAFGPRIHAEAKVLDFRGRLKALVRGTVRTVKEIVAETSQALLSDGTMVSVDELVYPTFHPSIGLTAALDDGEDDSGDEDEFSVDYPITSEGDTGIDSAYDELPGDMGVCEVCGRPADWYGGGARRCRTHRDVLESAAVLESELHDEPEPALPQTTGEDEEDDEDADQPEDGGQRTPDSVADPQDEVLPQDGVQAHLALRGTDSHAWLLGSGVDQSNEDIARAARETLAKQSVKTFSLAEQAEIIDEGSDDQTRARNLDSLDLEGTHYLGLEDALEEDDDSWLD